MQANDGKISDPLHGDLRGFAAKQIHRHLYIQVQPASLAENLQCHLSVVGSGQNHFVDKAGAGKAIQIASSTDDSVAQRPPIVKESAYHATLFGMALDTRCDAPSESSRSDN
jgi:hypothetical protein